MRNYVIINGVNSTTINGLAINEMPSITKPSIRTNTEEIDGRDGDIVTRLGYSAYDKEMTIGLYGSYDLDEIMSYFNQSGTIIFSTESDKYYNFEILEQIDYEKLLKFKTATITMHCQPFKYEVNETPIEIELENVTGTGETITLDNTKEAPLEIDLKGNTTQEGTPTPDAPVEVETTTGDNTINICGKNLFDKDNPLTDYYYDGNGEQQIVAGWLYNNQEIALSNKYTITFSKKTGSSNVRVIEFGDNDIFIQRTMVATNNTTITINENTTKVIVSVDDDVNHNNYFDNLQIEKGNQATTYEPYQSQSYSINLGDIELCKIGDYQDRIYKDSGKWYLEKNIGKVVLNGSESYGLSSLGAGKFYLVLSNNFKLKQGSGIIGIAPVSSHFLGKDNTGDFENNYAVLFYTNYTPYLRIENDNTPTLSNWETWLSTHNTTVYYILETPTTTEITDTELINQLDELESARSYDTTTNITQNTSNLPFLLTASTIEKGSNEGVITNEGNIYSRPTLTIEGTGVGGIYLNNNQMFSIDLTNSNLCVIDTTNLEAYNPNDGTLLNRIVTGDYDDFKLNAGNSNIKFDGSITKVTITNYSRWL